MARLLTLCFAAAAADAHFTRHIGVRCRTGFGGVNVDNTSTGQNISLSDCQGLCESVEDCVAFGHGGSKLQCWLLAEVSLAECDRSSHSWDTYTRKMFALPLLLQQQLDAVVTHYRQVYPNLTISLAWKDAEHELAVASGEVQGREATEHDTFLYGSGTKSVTATAVLSLVDSGLVQAEDPAVKYLDPYLVSQGQPKLAELFGEAVNNATVVDLIRMSSGVRDFEDDYSFDVWVLGNGSRFWDYPYEAIKFAVSDTNTQGGAPLYFQPGNGTAYSSTGYDLAGLLLAAVLQPEKPWYDFDLGSALPRSYSSMRFPPSGYRPDERLSETLTVPGASIADSWPTTTIYEQHPSVLGWTCGNMVARPMDVARFFFDLLGSHELVSAESEAEMLDFRTATAGWSVGHLQYGAGLMIKEYGHVEDNIVVHGHEGDTYGFISAQGYIPELGAAFSLATNVDNSAPMKHAACYLLQQARVSFGERDDTLSCSLPTLTTTTTTPESISESILV